MKTTAWTLLHGALSGLGLLMAGCSTYVNRPSTPAPAPVQTDYDVMRDLVFTPPNWPQALKADAYVPRGDGGPWPGVLLIHGGGWESGDRDQVASIARRLARRGFVVVNTTYRLSPGAHFPAALQDVQQALAWMQAEAAHLHLRPDRIAAFGYSAGAHLAALLGTISPGDALAHPGPGVAAVVAGGVPSDLAKFKGGKLVPQFLGTSWTADPEAYRRASPVTYISRDDPPFFLYHGTRDTLVPPDHAQDLHDALLAAGVHSELFWLRGRGHIAAFLTDGAAVDAASEFLDRQLR
jgi:acetyl esterase/lipase